jgi:hypothetical protein
VSASKILRVLAGQDTKSGRPSTQEIERLRSIGTAVLETDDVGMFGEMQQRVVRKIDRGPVGDIVEHNRPRRVIRERGEVLQQSALRRPRVIGT